MQKTRWSTENKRKHTKYINYNNKTTTTKEESDDDSEMIMNPKLECCGEDVTTTKQELWRNMWKRYTKTKMFLLKEAALRDNYTARLSSTNERKNVRGPISDTSVRWIRRFLSITTGCVPMQHAAISSDQFDVQVLNVCRRCKREANTEMLQSYDRETTAEGYPKRLVVDDFSLFETKHIDVYLHWEVAENALTERVAIKNEETEVTEVVTTIEVMNYDLPFPSNRWRLLGNHCKWEESRQESVWRRERLVKTFVSEMRQFPITIASTLRRATIVYWRCL